jgi:hypothetical protein
MDLQLPESVKEEDYLFITEVGSRMWGMADISSDHDLFFCYQTTASNYLRTGNFEPTRAQHKYVDGDGMEYDCQFMEIGHLVNLLMKGNVNMVWAVCSPIVHRHSNTLDRLKVLTESQLSKDSYASIKGMATSQFLDAEKRAEVRTKEKSLATCVRTLNFGVGLLYGRGCAFLPFWNATETMCKQSFEYLELAMKASTLPVHPRYDLFTDFLLAVRCIEIESHIMTRLCL